MASYFVDSSALVKRYRNEAGSQRVSEILESADQIIIARLTVVEVSAALVRRARNTKMAESELQAALAVLDNDLIKSFDVIELDEPLMNYAVSIARKHGLRGADAIQLSSVLLAKIDLPDAKLHFLSCDAELNAAGAAEGLQVEDPSLSAS